MGALTVEDATYLIFDDLVNLRHLDELLHDLNLRDFNKFLDLLNVILWHMPHDLLYFYTGDETLDLMDLGYLDELVDDLK